MKTVVILLIMTVITESISIFFYAGSEPDQAWSNTIMESIKTLAKKMGVSPATLNSWEKRLKLSLPRTSKGKLENADTALEVFRLVKTLRDEGSGFETIIRRLEPEQVENEVGTKPVQISHDLTEKYAQAMYKLGQKELELSQLKEENRRLRDELSELTPLVQEKRYKDLICTLEYEKEQLQKQLKVALKQQLHPFN